MVKRAVRETPLYIISWISFRENDNLAIYPACSRLDLQRIIKISVVGSISRCAVHFDLSVSGSCYMHETTRVSEVMAARARRLIVKAFWCIALTLELQSS